MNTSKDLGLRSLGDEEALRAIEATSAAEIAREREMEERRRRSAEDSSRECKRLLDQITEEALRQGSAPAYAVLETIEQELTMHSLLLDLSRGETK